VIYATRHKTNILPGDKPALLSETTPCSVTISQARVTVRINPIKQGDIWCQEIITFMSLIVSLIVYIPPSNKRQVYEVIVAVCIPLSSTSKLADPYPSNFILL